MTFKKRALFMAMLLVVAAILYRVAGDRAPVLIHYVVEQSLLQKAPPGVTAASVNARLELLLRDSRNTDERTQKLLRLSASLEKTQHFTMSEWDELLRP